MADGTRLDWWLVRQLDSDVQPAGAAALRGDPAAVEVHDGGGQRESKPGARLAPAGGIPAIEAVEELLQQLVGHRRPLVFHREPHAAVFRGQRHVHPGARRRVLSGIVEELIQDLRHRFTIIIVTHNMQQAARVSDRTAFFYLGKLIEYAPTRDIFTNPSNPQTEAYVSGRFG